MICFVLLFRLSRRVDGVVCGPIPGVPVLFGGAPGSSPWAGELLARRSARAASSPSRPALRAYVRRTIPGCFINPQRPHYPPEPSQAFELVQQGL